MISELYPIWTEFGSKDYLFCARETARWLRTIEIRDKNGGYWLKNSTGDTESGQIDLYHGSAGILIFFIQLAVVSGDASYLEDAKRGGDYILKRFEERGFEAATSNLDGPHYKSGVLWTLYSGGWSGIAFALAELYKAAGDQKYRDTAEKISGAIAAAAREEKGALVWSGKPGINFDSGIILYLIYASKFFGQKEWLLPAVRAGKSLLSTGKPGGQGLRYNGFVNMVNIMTGSTDEEAHMPGFAYGTAGISYTLARLYQETGDPAFLEGAQQGAAYLTSIAHTDGEAALIPHRLPDWSNLFYLGHCHGVVGTAKLFFLLHEITGESFYADWHERLIQGLLKTGAPEIHSPGYWHCFSWCCGAAGFINLFAGVYLKNKEPRFLEYARRSGAVILSEASVDKDGAKWFQMFKRIMPDEVTLEPGYGSGAAGIATALIHLYLAESGEAPAVRFPDEPYGVKTAAST
ncbi:MAG: AGE family epimerase/isomerase [Treponema sp.]|jgi:lantibiotic modifying enzyme|nr:AGE family epimerase/isomerase [Treponema sp.]